MIAGVSSVSLLQGALWTAARRVLNFGTYRAQVARAAAIQHGDRVVDIGCGTGEMAPAVPAGNAYVGVDLSLENVKHARRVYGAPGREFVQLDLTRTLIPGGPFDIALMIAVLHHMDDETAHAVLAQVAPQVTKRIVVLDLLALEGNPVQRMFVALDQGKHVRSFLEQEKILARHLRVVSGDVFATRSGSATHSLFVCEPPARASSHAVG
jgi:ubiquinone/menaquinone biosynthesis C-methylase UbiE